MVFLETAPTFYFCFRWNQKNALKVSGNISNGIRKWRLGSIQLLLEILLLILLFLLRFFQLRLCIEISFLIFSCLLSILRRFINLYILRIPTFGIFFIFLWCLVNAFFSTLPYPLPCLTSIYISFSFVFVAKITAKYVIYLCCFFHGTQRANIHHTHCRTTDDANATKRKCHSNNFPRFSPITTVKYNHKFLYYISFLAIYLRGNKTFRALLDLCTFSFHFSFSGVDFHSICVCSQISRIAIFLFMYVQVTWVSINIRNGVFPRYLSPVSANLRPTHTV